MDHKGGKQPQSLSQILGVSVTAILAVLLLGNLISNTLITQAHLQERMYSHARDAANSLGLSISTVASDEGNILAGRMIDSIFDSGDFASIKFLSNAGDILHETAGAPDSIDVPSWFVSILTLEVPPANANVMSGWSQRGRVEVVSRIDKAYGELWQTWVSQVAWFFLVLIIAIILVRVLLGRILKPLLEVEKQASEMSLKNFSYRVDMPDSRELASVVQAMNFMAESLGNVFDRQLEQIEALRGETRLDALTGLYNREGFDQRMSAELESEQGAKQGALFIINVHQLEELNHAHGRVEIDKLLAALGSELNQFLRDYADGFAARRTGGDFAVFLPSLVLESADEVSQELFSRLLSLRELKQLLRDNLLHIGIACVIEGDPAKDVLSKADLALREAQAKLVSAWQRYGDLGETSLEAGVQEANQWHRLIEDAIVNEGFNLVSQEVRGLAEGEVIYLQLLARLESEGVEYAAGSFLPMAKRFGMMPQIDRTVIEKILATASEFDGEFGISLSEESVQDAEFMFWFYSMMQSFGESAERVYVHFPEYALVNNDKQVRDLCIKLDSLGIKSVVERFGVSSVPFSYLQWLQLDAIKIDHSFIRGIDHNSENQFFLRSAIQMAHSRQVKVIAVGVETEAEARWLETVGIDGMMGYYFDRPKAIS